MLAGGCGGSGSAKSPSIEQGRPFADDFVQRLVSGRPVVDDTAAFVRAEMQRFQRTIRSNGVRRVIGAGVLRHDCPPNPTVDAGPDCFAYRLHGTQVVPVRGATPIDARFLLWVAYADGAWEAIHYDYGVLPSL